MEGGDEALYEWIYAIQRMIDWIEAHAAENPSLAEIAAAVGYSPFYCSAQFHRITGMTLKSYAAGRRLCRATLAVRDTDAPILDIALEAGFSSQGALTRAFREAYGCTPAAYRKHPVPIPLSMRKVVLEPSHYLEKGEDIMGNLVVPSYRIEYIPNHKYLGLYKRAETKNGELWPWHDCDLLTGMVESMAPIAHPVVSQHTAGWTWCDGKRCYFYGTGVDAAYSGEIPEGFELRGEFPGSYYIVFNHPPFDYLADNVEVMKRVEALAWNFDPTAIGYAWNEAVCQDYQRHYPEVIGYQVLRPVRKL